MKKILSILLTAAIMLLNTAVFADNAKAEAMEAAIRAVKEKIEISSDLSIFESSSTTRNEKTVFSFSWAEPLHKNGLSIDTDEYGNITAYYRYADYLYDDGVSGSADVQKSDYFSAADSFLKKIVPQLFEAQSNCLVYEESGNIINGNNCSFSWIRQKDGVDVVSDGATVNVVYTKGGFEVTDAIITWDYGVEFMEDYDKVMENPTSAYLEKYPIELIYNPSFETYYRNDEKSIPQLIYRFKDGERGYILADTGEKATEDDMQYDYRMNATAQEKADLAMGSAGSSSVILTQQEIDELSNISAILQPKQIIDTVNSLGVFEKLPDVKDFSSQIYSRQGQYIISLTCSPEDGYINISADGQTGKIISFMRSSYSRYEENQEQYDDSEYENAELQINSFLEKNYEQELAACIEKKVDKGNDLNVSYSREVNGVKYISNGISATYDMDKKKISSFWLNWDNDVSAFPKPEQVIGEEKARQIILESAPITLCYVVINKMNTLCYRAKSDNWVKIDALTGDFINDINEPIIQSYSDISGHWAEKQIKSLTERGAGLAGTEFKPDEQITQYDFLRMLSALTNYYSVISDEEEFYEDIIRRGYVTEQEKNPNAEVSRQDAFVMLIRMMGLSKIASLNDIYNTGFADGLDISADKIGAIAILRGFGIIVGDGYSIRPKDSITRAETAALLYSYLNADK